MKIVRALFGVTALAFVLVCQSPIASAQPPSVGVAYPSAIRPGVPTDVTFYGGGLSSPTGFWTNLPAQVELTPGVEGNGTQADRVTYRVTLPADTPVQMAGCRIATGQGISNIRLLLIDDLPTVADNGANKTIETAQELTLPVAVDGTCEAESFDYYKFTATTGQRLSVEVFARRLGFPLDPVVRLIDATGRELAYSDDEGGIGADCRFAYEFPADGQYTLEVRDIRYQGGGAFKYRVRLGDFPLVTGAFPLGARQGSTSRVEAVGPQVARALPIEASIPAGEPNSPLAVAFRYPSGQGSSGATLLASQTREQVEFEPNNAPEQSSPVTVPGAIEGRFGEGKDRDWYQFDVAAGQRLLFIGQTRKQGSPTDLFLRLYKADGSQLAEADDTGPEEGILNHTFAEAGTYRIMVEDLHRRGGPEHVYRVEVIPYQPGFLLVLENDKFDVPRGGVFVGKVTAVRFDYNGPITLSLDGIADGFALGGNVIPEGKNETVFSATAPANLEPGQWRIGSVVGRAKIGESEFVARARTTDALKGQYSGLPFPPAVLDGSVGIGIGPVFPDFFKLSLASESVRLPQLVGTTTFTVKAEKLNGFTDAIALAVEGLPAEITAEAKPIEKDKAEAQIVLKAPPTLALADYRVRIVGSGNFQNQPKSMVLEQVALKVVPPVEVALEVSGPVKAGEKVKVKAKAIRYGEEKPAIALAWQGLPLGVSPPEGTAIAEGQNEVEVELSTAANAMVGAATSVSVTASTKIQGRDITVQSPPASLEVTMP